MMDLVEQFFKSCEASGRKVYGLEVPTNLGIDYGNTATFHDEDKRVILPKDFKKGKLTPVKKHIIAHEVSEGLDHYKSHLTSDGIDGKVKKLENLSSMEWSNYLINVGMREGKAESGCDRILLDMREDIALKRHKKAVLWALLRWSDFYCSEKIAKSVLGFSEKIQSKSTSDAIKFINTFNKMMDDNSKTKEEKCDVLWSISPYMGGPDASQTLIELFPIPYTYSVYNSLQRLDNSGFQRFVVEWKPRDINEEVYAIDPLYYFVKNPSIPPKHKKIIEDSISSIVPTSGER